MTYVYRCRPCKARFEVIKSYKDMERNENCPSCGEFAIRDFIPESIEFTRTKVTHAEYNPGLGCVVKDAKHKDYLLKSKNLVEIGNDFGSGQKQQDKFDSDRAAKTKKRYEDAV